MPDWCARAKKVLQGHHEHKRGSCRNGCISARNNTARIATWRELMEKFFITGPSQQEEQRTCRCIVSVDRVHATNSAPDCQHVNLHVSLRQNTLETRPSCSREFLPVSFYDLILLMASLASAYALQSFSALLRIPFLDGRHIDVIGKLFNVPRSVEASCGQFARRRSLNLKRQRYSSHAAGTSGSSLPASEPGLSPFRVVGTILPIQHKKLSLATTFRL